MKKLFTALLFSIVPFSATALELRNIPVTGSLEFKAMCLQYPYIEKSLTDGGENRILTLSRENELVEIWIDHETETWSVILRASKLNVGCILGVGTGIFPTLGKTL